MLVVEDPIIQALPAIISAVTLGALGWLIKLFANFIKEHKSLLESQQKFETSFADFAKQQSVLIESQRNQIKDAIVVRYERAKERGYITHMELETMNRLGDSYFAMEGNSYIDRVLEKANRLPLGGEEIEYVKKHKGKK